MVELEPLDVSSTISTDKYMSEVKLLKYSLLCRRIVSSTVKMPR